MGIIPEPCAVGHAELGPSGLKLVAGPHWNPPTYSVLARVGLPEAATPLLDDEVPLVPQATSSGPPKASAPPAMAESRRKSRLDLREKTLIILISPLDRCPVDAGAGGRRVPVAN